MYKLKVLNAVRVYVYFWAPLLKRHCEYLQALGTWLIYPQRIITDNILLLFGIGRYPILVEQFLFPASF
jgi:hypothetical protein